MKICVLFVCFLVVVVVVFFVVFVFFVFRYLEKFTIQLENRSHKTTEVRNFDKRAKKNVEKIRPDRRVWAEFLLSHHSSKR